MTLKVCPNCGRVKTTKNSVFKGAQKWGYDKIALHFLDPQCQGNFTLRRKNWKEIMSKKEVA